MYASVRSDSCARPQCPPGHMPGFPGGANGTFLCPSEVVVLGDSCHGHTRARLQEAGLACGRLD